MIQQTTSHWFSQVLLKYLQHSNWHVREGALFLLAHCLIEQQNEKVEGEGLSLNPAVFQELVMMTKIEDKQKIQTIIVDVLALSVEYSASKNKTYKLIANQLGLPQDPQLQSHLPDSKELKIYMNVYERHSRGNLPYLDEDNVI